MLRGLDVLVVDLQDVGSRYYTFVWTMALAMRACARADLPVVVLDRPNPLGGIDARGQCRRSRLRVLRRPLSAAVAPRHDHRRAGRAISTRRTASAPTSPWCRWRAGGARWSGRRRGCPGSLPSPNMPTPDTARVYPGGCLIEGTNLSEGRGTTRPFELIGAPFLDGPRPRAGARRGSGLPGVAFRPAAFEPAFQKHKGQRCDGVQLHVTEPTASGPSRPRWPSSPRRDRPRVTSATATLLGWLCATGSGYSAITGWSAFCPSSIRPMRLPEFRRTTGCRRRQR